VKGLSSIIRKRKAAKSVFLSFIQSGSAGGVILFFCSIVALLVSNVPSLVHLSEFWEIPFGIGIGSFSLEMTLLEWVNDGFMAVFFFMVGLEIKREMMVGELSRPKQALLPIIAAVGGMIMPALIYLVFNAGLPSSNGWGIPMATDIAFAIAVLALLGKRCPLGLKVFLTALAIVDDLGSIIVLAIFYPSHALESEYIVYAAVVLAVLFGFNRMKWYRPGLYAAGGLVLWYMVLESGIHATVAGVLLALVVPSRTKLNEAGFAAGVEQLIARFKSGSREGRNIFSDPEQVSLLHTINAQVDEANPLMSRFEVALHPWVYFFIMPVFALANAGVAFGADAYKSEFMAPMASGIFLGLLAGKPLGIYLFSRLACRMKIAQLPSGIKWSQMMAIGIVGGIGFTMSLFIDSLAFTDPVMVDVGKAAIIVTSVVSAAVGYVAVSITGNKSRLKH